MLSEKQRTKEKVQLKIPAEVAKIMSKWGGHQVRLAAAKGALPMSGPNLVTVLFIFYHGDNQELKDEALNTLKTLPEPILEAALGQKELHPTIIDLIVRLRHQDPAVMLAAMTHPMAGLKTLQFLAQNSSGLVLEMLSYNDQLLRKADFLRIDLINNPHADKLLKVRLGWVDPESAKAADTKKVEDAEEAEDEAAAEELRSGFSDDEIEEFEDETLSKYQQLQEMSVAEKIKMSLTGDKEWRTLLLREANKVVCSAVLKNPRVTEGEVLTVAKNRSANEELIRIILLNREWLKNYEMKKALVCHPRTPLQKAMRFMTFLTERDIKDLAKSRNVSRVIVNNARRMLMTKKR